MEGFKEIDWEKYIQKTYVLYLKNRIDRREKLSNILKNIKTKTSNLLSHVTWWPGFKGRTEWDNNIHDANYSFHYHWLTNPFNVPDDHHMDIDWMKSTMVECSNPESNIALGHASILNDIVKNKIQTSLVLEDDIEFIEGFTQVLDDIFKNQLPDDWDILYISTFKSPHGFKKEPYSKDLVRLINGVYWTSGFMIRQRAAQKLVEAFPIVGPVDVWINHQFEGLNVYMTKENLAYQPPEAGSDNQYSFINRFGC